MALCVFSSAQHIIFPQNNAESISLQMITGEKIEGGEGEMKNDSSRKCSRGWPGRQHEKEKREHFQVTSAFTAENWILRVKAKSKRSYPVVVKDFGGRETRQGFPEACIVPFMAKDRWLFKPSMFSSETLRGLSQLSISTRKCCLLFTNGRRLFFSH